jgi:hypothetical protein
MSRPLVSRSRLRGVLSACLAASLCSFCSCAPAQAVVERPAYESSGKTAQDLLDRQLKAVAEKMSGVRDVRATLVRREMVNGVVKPEEIIDFRERFSPHSLRLVWTGPEHRGRKMIYVEGANNDEVLIHPDGLAGLIAHEVRMSIRSPRIFAESRYPPDLAGYDRLVARVERACSVLRSEGRLSVQAGAPSRGDGRSLQAFEIRGKYEGGRYPISEMIVWFDLDLGLPVRVVSYDLEGRMAEDYDWRDLQLNVGLTDKDFKF